MVGNTVGDYRVEQKLGAGGMGEVYLARDLRLGRDVAIKALPEAFARDPQRLARFEREAQLLAALNHPNIAAIHGLEDSGATKFLVLELVPGLTLAERLKAGRPPLDELVAIFRQIADALAAAHERGIVHRDLKPSNVKVTPEGRVKLLDFGLAKEVALAAASPSAVDLSHSPTMTAGPTQVGLFLGTAAYMSPEQVRGKPVDRRADVWAFGCVLYEALAGRQPFAGETLSDSIAAILGREPDWSALPPDTAEPLRRLLRRCLEKDRDRRLHDLTDARLDLDEALASSKQATPTIAAPLTARRSSAWLLPWTVTALALTAAILSMTVARPRNRASIQPASLSIALAATAPVSGVFPGRSIAVSPDGTLMAYVGGTSGNEQLLLRRLDTFEAKAVAGTAGAETPFFSPDGNFIGFFANGKLRTVSLLGGTPAVLADVSQARGGVWGPDGYIYFTPAMDAGIFRVPATGGQAEAVTRPDSANGERSHRWPHFLPGGDALLISVEIAGSASFDEARIAAVPLKTRKLHALAQGGSDASYLSGHLIFGRGGSLMSAPLDIQQMRLAAAPTIAVQGVITDPATGAAHYASGGGHLYFLPGGTRAWQFDLVWVNRKGAERSAASAVRPWFEPRLSPDGRGVAATIVAADDDIWVHDLGRGTFSRVTFQGDNMSPLWSPDGRRIAYCTDNGIGVTAADGSGKAELLHESHPTTMPTSWAPDGRLIAIHELNPSTQSDIVLLEVGAAGEKARARPFLRTAFSEAQAVFSPDGKWIAYTSNESGRNAVYVQAFPGPGGKWQVSAEGGTEPAWARSGRELFYRNGNKMMAVPVTTTPEFRAGKPEVLFEAFYVPGRTGVRNYDVSLDGREFLMVKSQDEWLMTHINVVLNWTR